MHLPGSSTYFWGLNRNKSLMLTRPAESIVMTVRLCTSSVEKEQTLRWNFWRLERKKVRFNCRRANVALKKGSGYLIGVCKISTRKYIFKSMQLNHKILFLQGLSFPFFSLIWLWTKGNSAMAYHAAKRYFISITFQLLGKQIWRLKLQTRVYKGCTIANAWSTVCNCPVPQPFVKATKVLQFLQVVF